MNSCCSSVKPFREIPWNASWAFQRLLVIYEQLTLFMDFALEMEISIQSKRVKIY